MIFISRKLIYHFDTAINRYMAADTDHVICNSCGFAYRKDNVLEMYNTAACPHCHSKLIEETEVYEYRNPTNPNYQRYYPKTN